MQLAKILVVDDEPDLQELIRQKFRSKIKAKEYEFHFAQNGAEALDKISNDGTIDLILTDINMPVMDGVELTRKLRANPFMMNVPVGYGFIMGKHIGEQVVEVIG